MQDGAPAVGFVAQELWDSAQELWDLTWRGAFRRAPWATFVRIGGPIRTGRTRARPVRDARAGVVTRGAPPVWGQ